MGTNNIQYRALMQNSLLEHVTAGNNAVAVLEIDMVGEMEKYIPVDVRAIPRAESQVRS